MNESCHTYEWVMSHLRRNMSQNCRIRATWLIHTCDMTLTSAKSSSSSPHPSLAVAETVSVPVRRDSWICAAWLIDICCITHSYVWHDSFICVAWLIHMCDMALIHVCDMTDSNMRMRHDSFMCETWRTGWRRPIECLKLHVIFCRRATRKRALIGLFCGKWPIKIRHPMGLRHPWSANNEACHFRKSHVTLKNEACHLKMSHVAVGWVISRKNGACHFRMCFRLHNRLFRVKLQVIFRKRATDYRALLWKMTYKDKASYGSSPPLVTTQWGLSLQNVLSGTQSTL